MTTRRAIMPEAEKTAFGEHIKNYFSSWIYLD